MKLNKSLLREILESCEKHIPNEENGNSMLVNGFPHEDFPSLNPFNLHTLKFHFKLLENEGYLLAHGDGITDGLTINGYKKLEELQKDNSSHWIFS